MSPNETSQDAVERDAIKRDNNFVSRLDFPQIANPYVIGDPVEGSLFIARDAIMRELEQLWVLASPVRAVGLFGPRRMGKTSLLLNIANGRC